MAKRHKKKKHRPRPDRAPGAHPSPGPAPPSAPTGPAGKESPPAGTSPSRTLRSIGDYPAGDDARSLSALLAGGQTALPYAFGWTDNRLELVRHFKHWVYVGIHKVATRVAAQTPNVSWVTSGGEPSSRDLWASRALRRRALTPLLTHERLEPVPESHPLLRLLRDPNDPDTSWDLWYETVLFLLLTGSAYWWAPKNGLGLPAALWVVPSHWMFPIFGRGGVMEAWEIRPAEGNYMRRTLPADEVVHFRFKNPISKLDGFAPLTAAAPWVDIHDSVDRAANMSYQNGPLPTVVVQFDGKMNDPTDEDLRRIEAKFLTRYAGPQRANKPMFLPPGVNAKPLTIKPNDMVFGQTGREMAHNILCALGVPPGSVFLDGDTLEAEAALLSQTVNPLCHFLGQVVSEKLARAYDGGLKVWWEAARVEDARQLNEDIKTDLLFGGLCPSEGRILRGREPWGGKWEEWGNTPIFPVNMAPGTLPGGGAHEPGDNNTTPSPGMPALNDEDTK